MAPLESLQRLRFHRAKLEFVLGSLPGRPVVILLSGWLAALAVVAVLLTAGREVAFERAHRSAAAFSMIVQENTARIFQSIDVTLGTIADAYQLAAPLPSHDPAFQALLAERLRALPDVRAIFVIDADGLVVHGTDYPYTSDISLADRPYFELHATDPTLERSVSMPLLSRSGTGFFIAVTHRLGNGPRFEGILVAAVQADRFETLFRKVGTEDGNKALALLHQSGELIARYPSSAPETGKSFASLPLFTEYLPSKPSDTFVTVRSMFPGKRVVSYRVIEGTPLLVSVSRSLDAVYAEWRRTAVAAMVAMVALTLLLSAFIAQLAKESQQRERERLRHAQAEKLKALGQLTGGIAHDFGNLVHIISTNLEMLKLLPPSDMRRSIAFETAHHATTRATELISRLLAFARRQPMERTACDLNELVTGSRQLIAQAGGAGVKISIELDPELPRVICDPGQFEIALVNVVLNASHAMSGAGRIVLKSFRCPNDDPYAVEQGLQSPLPVCLSVQDSGPGMPEDIRERVLEPFFTTKGPAGTGLGLAQVYGFMQEMSGDLRINSTPGKGTTICLYFVPMRMDGKTAR